MAETPTPGFLEFIRAKLDGEPGQIEVLEVGGGASTYVSHPRARYTVLEASDDVLATNSYADEQLFGDAHTFDFGGRRYDVVVFWNVLEHLEDPLKALTNACATLRPGGLLVVRGPTLRSLKSMIVRVTPHRVHVAFYRMVLKHPNAGLPGHAPFPIEHAAEADAAKLDAALARLGFEGVYAEDYVGDQLRLFAEYSRSAYLGYQALAWLVRRATLSRFGDPNTDFVRVYRRSLQPHQRPAEPLEAAEPSFT